MSEATSRLAPALLALAACAEPAASAPAPSVHAPALPAPIAQANDGRLQCYTPERTQRTCRALASYALRSDGGIDNTALVLVAKAEGVVMRVTTPVRVDGNEVCGPIRAEDLATATFTIRGTPATPEQTAKLREQMAAAMAPILGRETCTAYVADGAAFRAHAVVGGDAHAVDDEVIWVAPSDGYIVAP